MPGALTHVLTYFALLGLILTSAVTTFGEIGSSIGYQYARVAHALTGRADSAPARPHRTDTARWLQAVFPEDRPRAVLVDYEEGPAGTGAEEAVEERTRIGRHVSRMEQLADRISKTLAGAP